jgi:hypothetical protein
MMFTLVPGILRRGSRNNGYIQRTQVKSSPNGITIDSSTTCHVEYVASNGDPKSFKAIAVDEIAKAPGASCEVLSLAMLDICDSYAI